MGVSLELELENRKSKIENRKSKIEIRKDDDWQLATQEQELLGGGTEQSGLVEILQAAKDTAF